MTKDRSSAHLDPDVLERAIGDLRLSRMVEPDAADFARRLEHVRARMRSLATKAGDPRDA